MAAVTPFLMFQGDAQAAMDLYVATVRPRCLTQSTPAHDYATRRPRWIVGGSAYSPTLIMQRSAVSLTKGQPATFEKLADSGNIARREFCSACGTPLFASSSAAPEYLAVRASSLDDPSWFRPEANVWVASAQPWDHFNPTIPRFERNRPRVAPPESDA